MTPGATTTQTLPGAPTATSAADDVRLVLVASLLGAAAVHASVVQDHLLEWSAAGQFFVSLTVAGVLAAGALVRRAGPEQLLAALAVSVLPLVVWLVSRTLGLPFGPEAGAPEGVGLTDCIACALELVSAAAALLLLRRRGLAARPAARPAVVWAGLLAVALLTVVALAGSAHAEHGEHGRSPEPGHGAGVDHEHPSEQTET